MNAILMITLNGQQGELRDPIDYDATDADIKAWATEALRNGDVRGIDRIADPDLRDFVIDRFSAKDDLPARVSARPKVPFGNQALS